MKRFIRVYGSGSGSVRHPVYNYKSGQLPPTFQNYFTALNNIHVKPTRATSSHNFFVPFFKTLKLQRSIKYLGPKNMEFA